MEGFSVFEPPENENAPFGEGRSVINSPGKEIFKASDAEELAKFQRLCKTALQRPYRPLPNDLRDDAARLSDEYGAEVFRFLHWPKLFGVQCSDVDGDVVAFLDDLLDGADEVRIVAPAESFVLMRGEVFAQLKFGAAL